MDDKWKDLFSLVGVTAEQMQKKETMDFIYDFVEKRGGIDNVRREIEKEKATEPRKQLIFLFFSSWWIDMNCLSGKNVQN